MDVFEVEPRQMHNGFAVRNVVLVSIWIKEEIGRVQDPDALISMGERGDHVQAIEEGLVKVIDSIAIRILMDRDLVSPREFAIGGAVKWRRWRHLIKHLTEVLVPRENFESRGIWILDILHNPEPSTFVEVHEKRLPDPWLTEDGLDGQSSTSFEQVQSSPG